MKKSALLTTLLCLLCLTLQAQPHWNNLKVYRTGALLPHDRIIPQGDWQRSLNGTWAFHYFPHPDSATLRPDHWDSIRVPGNIELQGFGVPVYVNMRNEFPSNPPYAPTDYNPTGVYARDFALPPHWQGRRTIVKFGAVGAAMYLYINGREVGYSEDSKTPHEWDITRFLVEGRNRIAVKVLRWCDGSYMECQDMWRMSGITRDVTLYSLPDTNISDMKVVADLDTNNFASGQLDLMVDFSEHLKGGVLEVQLDDTDSTLLFIRRKLKPREWFANIMSPVGIVQPWTDSTPTLYTLTLRLYNPEGQLSETICRRIGFRHLSIAHGQLLINGKPIEIRGVNRHEHSAQGGHYITPDEMRHDIRLMKEMGINAVRTSHYPDDELWYDLCDSAGIYLWDEANLETHAQGYGEQSLAKKPEWTEPMLDRIYSMYRRDRNHPSVIVWSLGNECGNGVCMEEAYRRLKDYDPTRPVVYERAELDANTDIVELMYPSVQYLSQYARNPKNTRPYIMAEYCHAMGNSMGGLKDYWDTIDRYPQLQGGFLWDWIDQAFLLPNGTWGAGGDLGSLPGIKDDDAFCANGILAADRTPHPHAAEVEAVYTRHSRNIVLPPSSAAPTSGTVKTSHKVSPLEPARHYSLAAGRTRLRVNANDGSITSLRFRGKEILIRPLHINLWRPPTENDLADPLGARAWQGLDRMHTNVLDIQGNDNELHMLLRLDTPDSLSIFVNQIIEIADNNQVQLSYLVAPLGQFRTLPKLGIQFGLDSTYADCRFFGNLFETYPDRRTAQRVGRWRKSIPWLAAPQYVVPQEQGNREAHWVRFLAADSKNHPALTVLSPDTMLNFSVRQYADSVLTQARRWSGLQADTFYTVSIDHRVAPLGTATCGPGVDERYCIGGDSAYGFRFVLLPGNADGDPVASFAPHPDLHSLPREVARRQPVPIGTFACSQQPAAQYASGYPRSLADGRRAIPGDYGRGWTGFLEPDTLTLELTLEQATDIAHLDIGVCHAPSDWVIRPEGILMQWSRDGRSWSEWQPMTLPQPPATDSTGTMRLRYTLAPAHARDARIVRLRFLGTPFLPHWHPYAGKPSWLMLDEVEIFAH